MITKRGQEEYRKLCGKKYRERLVSLGKQRGEVCFGCREIFNCGGLILLNLCGTLDHMAEAGMIEITHNQPAWMDWATRMKN